MVFLPLITKTSVPILEGDFNLHKSNSTYLTDLDSSRAALISFLCFKGIYKTNRELSAEGKKGIMSVMLGSVYTNFKREIPMCHPYEVWSRILTWDQKWVYVVTHFVRKGKIIPKAFVTDIAKQRQVSKQDSANSGKYPKLLAPISIDNIESSIFATSVSKCVFKYGRMTVSPERIFRASGLFSAASADSSPIDMTGLQDKPDKETTHVFENKCQRYGCASCLGLHGNQ